MAKASMEKNRAEELIRSKVEVTRQKVAIAKEFFVGHFSSDSGHLLQSLLGEMDAVMPRELVSHAEVDPMPVIDRVSASLSWSLAGIEAIWGLIHDGVVMPVGLEIHEFSPHLEWTTVFGGSGGTRAGMLLTEFNSTVPRRLRQAPSREFQASEEILCDPDLYLRRIKIEVKEPIKSSLEEAVRCFRHGLYTACVAMLGKASEESWVELGSQLADAAGMGTEKTEELKVELAGWELGIQKKIHKVMKLIEREPIQAIMKSAGVRPADITSLATWSDLVRESRNVLHAGKEPLIPNTYEKVAVLLLDTTGSMETLFRLVAAVSQASAKGT